MPYKPPKKKQAQKKSTPKRTSLSPLAPKPPVQKQFAQNSERLVNEARGLKLKKSYSQNFLVNEAFLTRMVETMELEAGDPVLEIGPGAGFLTEKLLERGANVTSVELDPDMVRHLSRKWAGRARFTLVHQDILKFDLAHFLSEQAALNPKPVKIIGNLPYNITSSILFHLLGELDAPAVSWRGQVPWIGLMVQKEVGERITAKPSTKGYNPLSIAVQFWYEPKLELSIPAKCFYPPPKVDSVMVSIRPRTEAAFSVQNIEKFDKMIRSAFSQRRKTLKNSLTGTSFCTPEALQNALLQLSETEWAIAPESRAEALSISQLGALCNAFDQNPGQG